jgi:hypothetical protein
LRFIRLFELGYTDSEHKHGRYSRNCKYRRTGQSTDRRTVAAETRRGAAQPRGIKNTVNGHHRHPGTLDWAYPPFILGSTAAALGWDVSMFFTFYGLNLLKKDVSDLKVSPLGNPGMPMKMPFGPEWFKGINWNIPNLVQAGVPGFETSPPY